MTLTPASAAATPTAVFAVPNAHIDPVWIWDWREGMREVIATFEAAADRLDRDDRLSFTASSAAYYEWVEQMHPILFARIQAHVASGRWELVGGEWIEPDCNLPSGESVCRQLLYAQQYFARAFGRQARIAYNVDSFGHAGSLPQLFDKAGLRAYVMMRPQEHEKSLPAPLFRWQGIDGTSLPTFRIEEAYQTGLDHREEPTVAAEQALLERRAQSLMRLAEDRSVPVMFFVGVGDHGGGPTTVAVDQVAEVSRQSKGFVAFGSTARYFDEVERLEASGRALPTVVGDLHMHAVGCYSVVTWIKEGNARSERELVVAEKLASLCRLATGVDLQPQAALREAWTKVLFNQFHDSLGGTCTEEVCEDLRHFYGFARTVADDITTRATQLLAREIDTWVDGSERAERPQSLNPFVGHFPVPIVVFNPLARAVTVPIALPHPAAAVTDAAGGQLTVQSIPSREGTRYATHSLVVADLPAFGARVLWLHSEPATDARAIGPGRVSAGGERLESPGLSVSVDPATGAISSIVSTATGREWLAAGLRPIVLDDDSDTWSHGVVGFTGAEQPGRLESVTVSAEGPVRASIRVTYRYGESRIWQDVTVHACGDELEVRLHVDWRERHKLLKLLVPLDLEAPVLHAGLPYGAIERTAEGQEEVLHGWVQLTEGPGGPGVVCSTDLGCSYDATAGDLRLTVLRSPRYADHGQAWVTDDVIDQPSTDYGWHEVSYRFRFHEVAVPAGTGARQAEVHAASFPTVTETWHRGRLGTGLSGLTVSPESVDVAAVKRAEADDGWVVRLVERADRPAAAEVGLLSIGRTWEGRLRPYDVVTLHVPDDAEAAITEIAITELVGDLPGASCR